MNNDRRNFIRNTGVAVTAAVTGSSAAAAMTDTSSVEHKLGVLEDMNAIRALHQRYFALVQGSNEAELATLFVDGAAKVHEGSVLDARIHEENITVMHDRQSGTAELRSRVQLGTPMTGNGTLQQMARLQGLSEQQWLESGMYMAHCVKLDGIWKIKELSYRKA